MENSKIHSYLTSSDGIQNITLLSVRTANCFGVNAVKSKSLFRLLLNSKEVAYIDISLTL